MTYGKHAMSGCNGQYKLVCRDEFAAIHAKLDRLDEAIRGNGRPGIQVRLDRLEAAERSRSRLMWVITGAAVTLAASSIWQRIFGG
jgi:hypothetical protein